MNRSELAELLRNGESSGVEFKRADVRPERLAREIAALLNFEGGHSFTVRLWKFSSDAT